MLWYVKLGDEVECPASPTVSSSLPPPPLLSHATHLRLIPGSVIVFYLRNEWIASWGRVCAFVCVCVGATYDGVYVCVLLCVLSSPRVWIRVCKWHNWFVTCQVCVSSRDQYKFIEIPIRHAPEHCYAESLSVVQFDIFTVLILVNAITWWPLEHCHPFTFIVAICCERTLESLHFLKGYWNFFFLSLTVPPFRLLPSCLLSHLSTTFFLPLQGLLVLRQFSFHALQSVLE